MYNIGISKDILDKELQMNLLIIWWILGLVMIRVGAKEKYQNVENSSTAFTARTPVYYSVGGEHVGKQISFNFTAKGSALTLQELSIYIYSFESCRKIKIYWERQPNFDLNCTDSRNTTISTSYADIGGKFSFEIKDLELINGELIYIRISSRYSMDVSLQGKQKQITEKSRKIKHSSDCNSLERQKCNMLVDEDIMLYIIFGGSLPTLVIISFCIGVYYFLRRRKGKVTITTISGRF